MKNNIQRGGRIIVIVSMVAAVFLSGWFIFKAVKAYSDITAVKADNSPYSKAFQAKSYPAIDFVDDLLNNVPTGIDADNWNKITDSSDVTMLPETCTVVTDSNALLIQKGASGKGFKIAIQSYGAGQARLQYDKYASSLSKCYTKASANGNAVEYPDGYLFTYGDSIVSIQTSDTDLQSKLIPWFANKVPAALTTTQCIAMDETTDDAKRSFYYDANSYTGLIKTENVTQSVTFLQPSYPQSAKDVSYDSSKVFSDPKIQSVSVPLTPLPAGMQSSLPSAPSSPTFSSQPSQPSITKTITYQTADHNGPGCGWAWSGQAVPVYNTKILDANHRTLVSNAKKEIQDNADNYNQQIVDWSQSVTYTMAFSSTWDSYTANVNSIYASWKTLNDARNTLLPSWNAYIAQWKDWNTWDDRRTAAANQYAKDIQTCIASATSNGTSDANSTDPSSSASASPSPSDSSSASPTATPSPTQTQDTDAIQKNCEGTVVKPDILNQTKPSKPSRPTIPDGVTIPSSWDQDSE
jgi:hypothetical protein